MNHSQAWSTCEPAGWGSCLQKPQELTGRPPPKDAFGPGGKSPVHHYHLYSSPASNLQLCGLVPANRRSGSEDPWSPFPSPTNSEKCETWEVGKAATGNLSEI